MPLVLDILLLDEDPRVPVSESGYHVAEARGLFAELQRQLQEASSHLRRKSAFGALVARGASIRFVCHEQHEAPKECGVVVPPELPALQSETLSPTATTVEQGAYAAEAPNAAPLVLMPDGYSLGGSAPSSPIEAGLPAVPKILDFPRPSSRPLAVPIVGMDMMKALFNWMPTCAPTPCRALPAQAVDSCTILVTSGPEETAPCVPLPAGTLCSEGQDGLHEAGLGGWPLSSPHCYAAFPKSENGGVELFQGGRMRFHKAAVEIDDNELAVVFALQRREAGKGAGSPSASCAQTPSTASTAEPQAPQLTQEQLPPFVHFGRMVMAREWICNVKALPWLDSTLLRPSEGQGDFEADSDLGPPWPTLVEIGGTPHGAERPVTVLLALPSRSLVQRVAEALQTKPRRRTALQAAGTSSSGAPNRGAVRCELHLAARLNLDAGINSINCAAVVRRSISEACHVGAERVRVCSIWESDSSTSRSVSHRAQSTGRSGRFSSRGFPSESDAGALTAPLVKAGQGATPPPAGAAPVSPSASTALPPDGPAAQEAGAAEALSAPPQDVAEPGEIIE